MKQISKKDLIKLITESSLDINENEILDEMATDVKGPNPWDDPNFDPDADKDTECKARFFNRQWGKDYKEYDPTDVWIYNVVPKGVIFGKKMDKEGRGIDENGEPKRTKFIILTTDVPEKDKKNFSAWVQKMEQNGYKFYYKPNIRTKDDPLKLSTASDSGKITEGLIKLRLEFGVRLAEKATIHNSVSENINIGLKDTIRKSLEHSNIQEHLIKCGIPPIFVSENVTNQDVTSQKHGTDDYSSRNNDKIEWSSNRKHEFKSLDEFTSFLEKIIGNQETNMKSSYSRRQYVKGPKQGVIRNDQDIIINNKFHVKGEKNGSGGWVWHVSFVAGIGMMDLGLNTFASGEGVAISNTDVPGHNGCVMTNKHINHALHEAMAELKADLAQITPQSLVDQAMLSVKGLPEYFAPNEFDTDVTGQPEMEPQTEPSVDAGMAPKKTKKITKEAIEAMVQNMLKESLK